MKKLFSGFLTVLLSVLFLSCGREEVPPPPDTDSETLNQLLNGAPFSRINLHESGADTLMLPGGQVVDRFPIGGETRRFRGPDQVVVHGEQLVVLEYTNPELYVLNREGESIRILNSGDQLSRPTAIMSDGTNLYVYDDDEKTLARFDSQLEYQESVSFRNPYFMPGSVGMNRSYILYQPDEATGFRVSETDKKLLTVVRNDQAHTTAEELMPRIIPSGKQPGGFNNLTFSINRENSIVAAYPALPYIFIFHEFEHSHTILFDEEPFAAIENPPLSPFQPVMGEAVSVRSLIDYLHITDHGDVLVFSQGELFHLKTEKSGTYTLSSRYVLVRGDTGERINSLSSISNVPDDPDRFYGTGDGILFGLILPG
ncbi:hypothetical protein DYD21_00015 [Rhodohalobacter sp. SW132]|uniref:hypothetical protein n=1 Tax=Rhodohalobacter sp. SW132 TaxID=2293433 RepID=UPI000E2761CC|nr:hypothetical protein [Rhodohalobacter sp. SW132]REL38379.1 hypothetical protein DYD21_00015 [Rhodohalobacter sp. SW132]